MPNYTIDATKLTDDDHTKVTVIPSACIARSTTRRGAWNAYSLLPVQRVLGEYDTERAAQNSAEQYTDQLLALILATVYPEDQAPPARPTA